MRTFHRSASFGLVTLVTAVLTACGGGGGSAPSSNNSSFVSGVAATGLAIRGGEVALKCAAGTTSPATTNADGSYTIDVSNATLPCIARVDYSDSTGQHHLHSLVQASGTVNITPITDAVVARLSSTGVARDSFDQFDADEVRSYSTSRVTTAMQTVKTHLESLGVNTAALPTDVIGTRFTAKHDAGDGHDAEDGDDHDKVLDDLKVKLEAHNKTLDDVEHEMHAGDGSHEASTTTGTTGDAGAGQTAYTANCVSCHGARMADAVNAAEILDAIGKNEGGMGVLAATVNATMANNIATYMTSVISGGTVNITKTAQTISFTNPGSQTMGVAPPALVATASSGLTVSIDSDTKLVCTVSGTTLTLVAPGSCRLTATQAGNTTYGAATPVSVTFTVQSASGTTLTSQTITFTSPGAQVVGTTASLTASSSSNLAVSFASTTAGVCTVSGSTLTPVAAGTCTITANQGGDATYAAAATVTRSVTVTGGTTSTVSATNGKTLYASNSCGMCHGNPPSRSNVGAGASNPTVIRNAITGNLGGMGMYSSLTDAQLADIAAYLATPTI